MEIVRICFYVAAVVTAVLFLIYFIQRYADGTFFKK